MITIKIGGIGECRALARRLHRAARQTGFNRNLRRTVHPEVNETGKAVRRAARSLPDGPPKASTGLRRNIARATEVRLSAAGASVGGVVFVNRRAMPPDQANLPARMEEGRWRHPVFGNRNAWVSQTSRARWFSSAVQGREPQFEAAIIRAMETTAQQIAG